MRYIDGYKSRKGKCEFCKFHNVAGSYMCAECYDCSSFKDKLDLVTFIRKRAYDNALNKFIESDECKHLRDLVEQQRKLYYKCKFAYDKARTRFVDDELKRIDEIINSIKI